MQLRTPSYVDVLRTPHATRTFGAALVGRLCYGITPLSLMLALTGSGRSYAVAGGAEALFAAGATLLAPLRARLIDRHGLRRALLPMALVFALLLAMLGATTWWHGVSVALIIGVAGAAGSCAPPLGPTMRALWNELIPESPDLLRRAFSLDTVAEEVLFLAGPLLAGLVATVAVPSAGLLLSATLVACGTTALVTSPVVRSATHNAKERGEAGRVGRAIVQPVLAALGIGLCLGTVSLLMVAFARFHHQGAAVAWCSAALSAGSALGGLAYGAVNWKLSSRKQLPILVAGPAIGIGLAGLSPNLVVLALMALCTGVCISPGLSAAYLVANQSAAPQARVRAGTWVNTAVNAGNTTGAATIGFAISNLPLHTSFALAAAPALVLAGAAFLFVRGKEKTIVQEDSSVARA
ncbi:MFS transporter [Streptomyces camelliae]|uniref:MFS transporter n=1 Tax=Streptomyces camelliae TaxID=3004093 RepID=A0ABY7P3M2_9ACTN|nr:MFS transporter [Streptomyces sp. HUAS 2-6]WBO65124.1 MFS transporter [Streptomyces sp. HUAS 2-6]